MSQIKRAGSTGVTSFTTIQTPAGTSPVADSASDTLTLAAGTGITITGDSTTDTVTIAAQVPDDLVTYTQFGGL